MTQRKQFQRPPQHKNPSSANRTALAPYNFVPITDRLIAFAEDNNPLLVSHDHYDAQRLTGWIDVELETKTPIYVRGPLELDEFEQVEKSKDEKSTLDSLKNKPDFFYTDDPDAPEIPGSSLRGMLRAIVEILGHGKLTPVPTDRSLAFQGNQMRWLLPAAWVLTTAFWMRRWCYWAVIRHKLRRCSNRFTRFGRKLSQKRRRHGLHCVRPNRNGMSC